MFTLFAYSLSMAIVLLILVPAYHVSMSHLQCHKVNRVVLLAIALIGVLTYPFLASPMHPEMAQSPDLDATALMMLAEQSPDNTTEIVSSTDMSDMILRVFAWVFIGGMIVTVIVIFKTWIKVGYIIYKGEKHSFSPYTIVAVSTPTAPFSFGKFIVLNKDDYKEHNPMILAHEKKHLSSGHTWDLLLCQIILILNWYNPAAWGLMSELKTVHEYQADKAVLDCGMNATQYQLMLIKKAVGTRFPSVTNSLNHSKLKKRITMMLSSKNGSSARWRAMTMVPAVALALVVVNHPAVANTMEQMKSVNLFSESDSQDKSSESLQSLQIKNEGVAYLGVPPEDGKQNSVPNKPIEATIPTQQTGSVSREATSSDEEITYTGNVTDRLGNPIPGVIVQSGKSGVTTDLKGNFSLKALKGNPVKIMYVGYETISLKPGKADTGILVKSDLGTITLEESPIGGEDCSFDDSDVNDVIIIDGVECTKEEMKKVDPSTIESITVKKDTPKNQIIITTKKSDVEK